MIASNWTSLDWAVVVVYLLCTLALSVWVQRLVHDMADFVVAGRRLGSALSIASMVGGELGLVTVMFSAQKGLTGGFAAFHIPLVAGFTALFIGLTGFLVVPLRRLGVMTIPEFYERRFSRRLRIAGGLVLALSGILNMGLFLRAGSLFVTGVTGMTSDTELKLIMSVLLVLVLVYVVLGGMMAVVLTDYVQFVVLSIGMLVACWFGIREVSWSGIVETVQSVHGAAGFDPTDTAGFGPWYIVWMVFTAGIVSCAVWQPAVLRALSAESEAVVRKLYVFSSLGFMVRFLLPNLLGLCALAWIFQNPGVLAVFDAAGGLDSSDNTLLAMPRFLGAVLPTGILGLVGAGMLAAFMSTHDSYLLCWSSVLTQDVIAPVLGDRMTQEARMRTTRTLVVVTGVFLLLWSLWYPLEQDLWDYMAITGAIYFTGAFALLALGLYWRRASTMGAWLALASGGVAVLGLPPVARALGADWLAASLGVPLSGELTGLAAVALSTGLMVLGSLLFPDRCEEAS